MKYDNLYLRKRPSYDEMIDYIEIKNPKIKFPNRLATFFRNSPYGSQFDGDNSFINLEEQENNIAKQRLQEEQIKKISSETQTTAQVIRATNKHISIQTGGVRNTETSGAGTQTDPPVMVDKSTKTKYGQKMGSQTDPINTTVGDTQTDIGINSGTQTNKPQIFDMTVDDEKEDAMQDIESEKKKEEAKKEDKKKNIKNIVSKFLGESVSDVPYLPGASSSSNEPAEDTSRPRGRPPLKDKPIQIFDGSEDTIPMVVNREGEQQKRTKDKQPSVSPPPNKKQNKTKQEEKEQARALAKAQKEERAIVKAAAKAEAKAKAVAKAAAKAEAKAKATPEPTQETRRSHGVDIVENKNRSFWKQQNITFIKQQAELRGHRFTDLETKGGTKSSGGVITKFNKFKKQDYLEVLFKILKI